MSSQSILTSKHIARYERDGFLHLSCDEHKLVSDPSALSQWASEIQSWPREKGKWMPYDEVNQEGTKQLMRTENIVAHFPPIANVLLGEGVLSILKQLSGKVRIFSSPHSASTRNILLFVEIDEEMC